MVRCPAYGIDIAPAQCDAVRGRFWLEKVCGGCSREETPFTPMAIEMAVQEEDPGIPDVGSGQAQANTISGVRRTGPTIETALRRPMLIFATSFEVAKISPKSKKPRRRLPPGMTRAVAESMGLI